MLRTTGDTVGKERLRNLTGQSRGDLPGEGAEVEMLLWTLTNNPARSGHVGIGTSFFDGGTEGY